MTEERTGLSAEELDAQGATALPDKEVVSILDLNADLNLAIDAAAPIDLAAAANANIAAPIDAAVGANVLSIGSTAQALSDQGTLIDQDVTADATAHATQDSGLNQSNDTVDGGAGTTGTDAAPDSTGTTADSHGTTADSHGTTAGTPDATAPTAADAGQTATSGAGAAAQAAGGAATHAAGDTTSGALDGNLLNVNVNLDADADIAAPINGAVAANANVAAPIDASVAANVGSVDSDAVSVSQQDAIINQHIEGSADATSDQHSDIDQ